jgi:hypothetical protein
MLRRWTLRLIGLLIASSLIVAILAFVIGKIYEQATGNPISVLDDIGGLSVLVFVGASLLGIIFVIILGLLRYLASGGPNEQNRRSAALFLPDTDALAAMSTENVPHLSLFSATVRISTEIQALERRGNVSLVIGIATSAIGVIALALAVYGGLQNLTEDNWKPIALRFLSRLSIAIFIQIFAYFFLRLYRSGLEDIKFYQNELTNIELKWASLRAALHLKNAALLKVTVEALSNTERNFVLKKGTSTVGLERDRLEKNEIIELVKEAMGAVAKIKPGK